MPLIRDHEQFEFERFEGVYFWMRDDANHILCKVSHEALRDRSACDGEKASSTLVYPQWMNCST